MMVWYLVRHGQTQWNAEKRIQGSFDSPLTEAGVRAAMALGRQVEASVFDAIYVSPSMRAVKTLELVLDTEALEIAVRDPRIAEIKLGNWQGKCVDEIAQMEPVLFDAYYNNPRAFQKEGAETYEALFERVAAFIESVEAQYADAETPKQVFVMTHGVTLMMMEIYFQNQTVDAVASMTVAPNVTPVVYRKVGKGHYVKI
ncbi:histidine phosphatase family protein [Fusibacter sp. JL298sf-3]